MKTISVSIIAMLMVNLNCWAGEPLFVEKIPNKVKSYINLHYPDLSIVKSEMDKDLFNVTYEIVLSNQVALDFNEKCDIIEIDGKTEIPESIICTVILTYVNNNYPNNYITGWKLKKFRQQIELDNDLDLLFNNNGDFKGFDH